MDLIVLMMVYFTIPSVISGQPVTGPVNTTVESGDTAQLVCSVAGASGTPYFTWNDVTVAADGSTGLFFDGRRTGANDPKYANFNVSESNDTSGGTSTLIISDIAIEDEGQYQCRITGISAHPDAATITVEVRSNLTLSIPSSLLEGENATAQCDAIGGRPQETLTWYINDVEQTTGVEVTNPTDPVQANVTNTRSVFTFTPTRDNDGQVLSCRVTGHTLAYLNQEQNTPLNVHWYTDCWNKSEIIFSANTSTRCNTATRVSTWWMGQIGIPFIAIAVMGFLS